MWPNSLTLRPRIWLIAADSLSVLSSITFCRCSFMKSINAFSGFFTYGRFFEGGVALLSLQSANHNTMLLTTDQSFRTIWPFDQINQRNQHTRYHKLHFNQPCKLQHFSPIFKPTNQNNLPEGVSRVKARDRWEGLPTPRLCDEGRVRDAGRCHVEQGTAEATQWRSKRVREGPPRQRGVARGCGPRAEVWGVERGVGQRGRCAGQ